MTLTLNSNSTILEASCGDGYGDIFIGHSVSFPDHSRTTHLDI